MSLELNSDPGPCVFKQQMDKNLCPGKWRLSNIHMALQLPTHTHTISHINIKTVLTSSIVRLNVTLLMMEYGNMEVCMCLFQMVTPLAVLLGLLLR